EGDTKFLGSSPGYRRPGLIHVAMTNKNSTTEIAVSALNSRRFMAWQSLRRFPRFLGTAQSLRRFFAHIPDNASDSTVSALNSRGFEVVPAVVGGELLVASKTQRPDSSTSNQ